MEYTLETATQRLHDVRRQLAQLEERAGSQRQRLAMLESQYRAAQRGHSEALAAKAATLAEFVAGSATQTQVDNARRVVDECVTQMRQAEELAAAVEADVRNITAQTQKFQMDIGPVTTRAWRAVYEHLAANRPPEVDAYLPRLWAAAKAAGDGHADFGAILGAVHQAFDFTASEQDTREMLSKEFFL